MRKILTFILTFFSGDALSQSVAKGIEKDEIVHMADEAPAMRKAFAVARASLDDFLTIAKKPPEHLTSFALKVAVSDGGSTEYFWVTDFEAKGGARFSGEINNEPRVVKTVKMGQRYAFARSQIVDWMYMDESEQKIVGNLTMCALLTQESKEDAEELRKQYKLDCSKIGE